MNLPVVIHSSDAGLRRALSTRLGETSGLEVVDGVSDGTRAVVVAPAGDCSPAEAMRLTTEGHRVIILAPIVRERDRSNYTQAGVSAYLAMNFDLPELSAAIVSAGETLPGSPMVRAVSPQVFDK